MAAVVIWRLRRSLRQQRIFRDRRHPLDIMTDHELHVAFRFRRHDLLDLCNNITPDIEFAVRRQGSLPPILQVLLNYDLQLYDS